MYVCPECGDSADTAAACPRDGAPREDQGTDTFLGLTMGSYRVTRLIGAGGMGRVYRAVQPEIGGRVAIKVLSEACALEPRTQERFFAEARAVNLIRHEKIVNIVDLARLPDGRPYIVMEYLDGSPLSAVLRGYKPDPLPLAGFVRLMLEVLDGVGAAHDKGVVHRDLKPDNIFVSPQGHATVLDFGIAKLAETDSAGLTQTGALLGTPKYMSPEQVMGLPADARADVYALGVILYEGVVGAPPFAGGPTFELMRQHVEVAPMPPSARRADTPLLLEGVIMRALDKRPDRRFADAHEMRRALFESLGEIPHDSLALLGQRQPDVSERPQQAPAPSRDELATRTALPRPISETPAPPLVRGDTTGDLGRTIPHTIAQTGPALHGQLEPPQAPPVPPRRRAPVWPLALAVLVVFGGAGAVGTTMYLRGREGSEATAATTSASSTPDDDEPALPIKKPKKEKPKEKSDTEAKPVSVVDDGMKVSPEELANFDVLAWMDRMKVYARAKYAPDVELVMIYAPVQLPGGNVDLSTEGDAVYYFVSRAHKDAPEGCAKYVSLGARGVALGKYASINCEPEPFEKPRCTVKQATKKAMKFDLADTKSAQATLQYLYLPGAGIRWSLVALDGKSSVFADDCP